MPVIVNMNSKVDLRHSKFGEEAKNFLIGGSSGMIATVVILPVDYVKVHVQCMAEGRYGVKVNAWALARTTLATRGISEFYSGLTSAILRQAVYATTRLGLYKTLADREKERTNSSSISFTKKSLYSVISGGIGAIVGNPCDIALIRLQTDHSLPPSSRRNYSGILNALYRIGKEEGLAAYWTACTPTVMRACSINFGMLAPYDQCKEFLDHNFGASSMNRIYSSLFAAVCACIISLPFDNVKVKCQKMVKNSEGVFPYSGFFDCLVKTSQKEGFKGFYAGFSVYTARIGPHAIITLLAQDFLHQLLD
jgi:solute carrier family 25 oxoglutarate transporter 11